ncbi:hypothetical protein NDN08_001740 [Rhodosorus marinus]|uniref:Uncharacterized protein n=1 Tax=Rhodosorus marinus TaxID=101924 RepID=A0AAV8UVY2_9RHOD|nr:hypothetical protein NDN08_001740 [Rhodosorus marinus]
MNTFVEESATARARRKERFERGSGGPVVQRFSELVIGGQDGLTRTPAREKDRDSLLSALEKLRDRMKVLQSKDGGSSGDEWEEVTRGFRRLTMTATSGSAENDVLIAIYESAADASLFAEDMKVYSQVSTRLLQDFYQPDSPRYKEFCTNRALLHGLVKWNPRQLILGLKDAGHLEFVTSCISYARKPDPVRYFETAKGAPYDSSKRLTMIAATEIRRRALMQFAKAFLSLELAYVAHALQTDSELVLSILEETRPDLKDINSIDNEELQFRRPKSKKTGT